MDVARTYTLHRGHRRRVGISILAILCLALVSIGPQRGAAAATPATLTFAAQADARVQEANRTSNYGTSTTLRVDGGTDPDVETYLRFGVTGLPGRVQSARLRVRTTTSSSSGTVDGPAVYTAGNDWTEKGITWSKRPARTTTPTDDKGALAANTWIEFDVTSLVKGDGTYSFVLATSSTDSADFSSRESSTNKPELVVTTPPTLASLIGDVTTATAYRYGTQDDLGGTMDTLKVIPNPAGGYLGVYHTLTGADFTTRLATSTDLLSWTRRVDFDFHASQPTLAALSDGGFLMAEEYDAHDGLGSHLRFRHYSSLAALLSGVHDAQFDAPRSLSACAEGTPNIYSATLSPDIAHSTIDVGFHYFSNCDVDRQGRGTLTNFSTWSARTEPALDSAILNAGQAVGFPIGGNIGDRDYVSYDGKPWNVHEGQGTKGDFGSWRSFLYDPAKGTAAKLSIKTHSASTAFANPTLTDIVSPSGKPAMLVTLFLPSEGAALGEGGELVYYTEYAAGAP